MFILIQAKKSRDRSATRSSSRLSLETSAVSGDVYAAAPVPGFSSRYAAISCSCSCYARGQTVIVGLDVADWGRDVFAAHFKERADIDDYCIDGAMLVEDQIADFPNVAVVQIVDRATDHLTGADFVLLNDMT